MTLFTIIGFAATTLIFQSDKPIEPEEHLRLLYETSLHEAEIKRDEMLAKAEKEHAKENQQLIEIYRQQLRADLNGALQSKNLVLANEIDRTINSLTDDTVPPESKVPRVLEVRRSFEKSKTAATVKYEQCAREATETYLRQLSQEMEVALESKDLAKANRINDLLAKFQLAPLPGGGLTNSVGMKFQLRPIGNFRMGEGSESRGVNIAEPFYIGVYEVTVPEWNRVMGIDRPDFTTKLGVTKVTWYDAVDFCRRMSELPEEESAGRVYRLPNEAEWEYACRAGTKTAYNFGDDLSLFTEKVSIGSGRSGIVGTRPPNGCGLYDMHGNNWEWCQDEAEDGRHRVKRGGGRANSATRDSSAPSNRLDNVGFRVVMTVKNEGSYSSAAEK